MKQYAFRLLAATMLASGMMPATTKAQGNASASSTSQHDFSIPAGRLSQSVITLSQQAGVQVVFDSDTTGSADGNAVTGRLTVEQALNRLIGSAGLRWRWLRTGVVTIEAAVADDGERITGTVRVEGMQGSPYFGGAGQTAGVNGVNGSRDITATEGTGSFTSGALTVGSKVAQSIKDVPQSVSVITSERLAQQNVQDYTQALRQLPGVTLSQGGVSPDGGSNLETTFSSRGYEITSIQVDGGAPLMTGNGYYPQIDLSVYDHVELVRGATGQFNGFGDPSGSVNLVRKKPLDHAQYTLEGQVGSWQNYRLVADATSPLGFDGRLRGRLVMTYQDQHHFYRTAKDNKSLIYGIAEFDVTPTTLLTAGINYTRQDSLPWLAGLPRYQDGNTLDVPRSTSLATRWSRWNFRTTDFFGGIEQKIGTDWTAKVNVTHSRQTSVRKAGFSTGTVNPLTDLGPRLQATYNDYASKQLSMEAVVSGAFELFGQRQEIVVGANRSSNDADGQITYAGLFPGSAAAPYQPYPGGPTYYFGSPNGPRPPINVFDFDPYDPLYNEPRDPLPSRRYSKLGTVQSGAYVTLRMTAFDRLHLTAGLRYNRYVNEQVYDDLCVRIPTTGTPSPTNCVGRKLGDPFLTSSQRYSENHISWPPNASLSYDITDTLTGHFGYTAIYRSQANYLNADGDQLPPVRGSNFEGGLKWQARGGKLNLALAAYRSRQTGYFTALSDFPDEVSPGIFCCYVSDSNVSQVIEGIDTDITGEILPGWQVAASYTYNRTKFEGAEPSFLGQVFLSSQPKHVYKLWMSYDFGAAGAKGQWSRMTLSGGVNAQSSAFIAGAACVNLAPPNALGISDCVSFDAPDFIPFNFTIPAYAVLAARVDYRISDKWSLSVNFNNLLDKVYYTGAGQDITNGNWYGEPRSAAIILRAKW